MDKFFIPDGNGGQKEVTLKEFLQYHIKSISQEQNEELLTRLQEKVSETKESMQATVQEALAKLEVKTPKTANQDEPATKTPETFRVSKDGLMELSDGSLFDTKRREWKALGQKATDYALALQDYFRAVETKRAMSSKSEQLLEDIHTKMLNEDISTQGGYLVPPEYSLSILEVMPEIAVFVSRAQMWDMTTTEMSFPVLDQTVGTLAADDSDFFAGVSGSWINSGDEKPESEPKFRQITLHPNEWAGYTELQNALLQSSPINLMNYITALFSRKYNWDIDLAMFRGTGVKQPLGILTDPQIPTVNRQTASAIEYKDLLNMDTAFPGVFDAGSMWFGNKQVLNSLRGEVDSNNRPLIQVMDRGELGRGVYTTLLGRPFINADYKTKALGTSGDLILCNPSMYYIGNRNLFSVEASRDYKFRHNRTAIRISNMVDGKPAQSKAFLYLAGTVAS